MQSIVSPAYEPPGVGSRDGALDRANTHAAAQGQDRLERGQGDSPLQALFTEHAELNLSHVQPTRKATDKANLSPAAGKARPVSRLSEGQSPVKRKGGDAYGHQV